MYCTNCGKEREKEVLFCSQCGAKQELIAKEEEGEERIATAKPMANMEKETPVIVDTPVEERPIDRASVAQADKKNMPGRKMLKVVGIISIVFGSLSLLGGLGELTNPYTQQLEVIGLGLPLWYATYLTVANIVLGGLMLTMGILGIVWCTKKEKAGILAILAIVMLALLPITTIFGFIEGNGMLIGIGIGTILLNAVLPILFLIGALRRKNSQI